MSIAKKTVYAAAGVAGAVLDRAKTLPKLAAEVPGTLTEGAKALTKKTGSLRELPSTATELTKKATKRAVALPAKAAGVVKNAGSLPKQATALPKAATEIAGKATKTVRAFATETAKDANKRFAAYAKRGEKLLARNGTSTTKKTAAVKKPRASKPKTGGNGSSTGQTVSVTGADNGASHVTEQLI